MACGVCSEGIGPRRLEFPRLADGGRALVCGGMNAQHGHEEEEGYGEDVGDVSVALCDALLAARGNSKSRYLFTSDRLRYERRTHTHTYTHTHTHTHIYTHALRVLDRPTACARWRGYASAGEPSARARWVRACVGNPLESVRGQWRHVRTASMGRS